MSRGDRREEKKTIIKVKVKNKVTTNMMIIFIVAIVLLANTVPIQAIHFHSGEYFHDQFVPFHSSEVDHHYLKHGHHLHSNHHPSSDSDVKVRCFGYKAYPLLNNYPKPKKAPPAPLFDDFDTMFGPQAITSGPIIDDFFNEDYLKFNSDKKDDGKVPFEVCFDMCPAPKRQRFVCGDDGRTYQNIYKLNCAVRCGRGNFTLLSTS